MKLIDKMIIFPDVSLKRYVLIRNTNRSILASGPIHHLTIFHDNDTIIITENYKSYRLFFNKDTCSISRCKEGIKGIIGYKRRPSLEEIFLLLNDNDFTIELLNSFIN